MDLTALLVAAFGALAILFPAYWSYKAARNTKPVNGQNVSEQVDQLHRLFITHDDADKVHFGLLNTRDGELAAKIHEVHDYNRERWHKDDTRYAVTLAVLATLADQDLSEEMKSERYEMLYDTAQNGLRWHGENRRREERGED